jgi:radical SAM protein with 4Fe4S-binding SPASM domain
VFFEAGAVGHARPDQALFEQLSAAETKVMAEAEALAASLGIMFSASGASEPETSLKKSASENPWSLCRRPWTVMYFTANGRALPCCIAPFAQHGYENFTLGDATQHSLRDIWNGPQYQTFRSSLRSDKPPECCQNCGLRWSL